MQNNQLNEILLVRHAKVLEAGRLIGQTDVVCETPDQATAKNIKDHLGNFDVLISSPAKRCKQTAKAIFPNFEPLLDKRLWEQNFGAWETLPYEQVPDIGELSTEELALQSAPNGESFIDVYNRCIPAIKELSFSSSKSIFVVHAGIIRSILGKALAQPELGLLFNISNLSITSVNHLGDDNWSINYVNRLV